MRLDKMWLKKVIIYASSVLVAASPWQDRCTQCRLQTLERLNKLRDEIGLLEKEAAHCCSAGWNYHPRPPRPQPWEPWAHSHPCPPHFTQLGPHGNCYRFSTDEKNWFEARDTCRAEGADLIAIESHKEQWQVVEHITGPLGGKLSVPLRFFTGGNELDGKGHWQWGRGPKALPFGYTQWHHGEPNDNKGHEECVELNIYHGREGGWNDVPCDLPFKYICEKPPHGPKPPHEW